MNQGVFLMINVSILYVRWFCDWANVIDVSSKSLSIIYESFCFLNREFVYVSFAKQSGWSGVYFCLSLWCLQSYIMISDRSESNKKTERLGNRLVKTNDSISYADDNGRRSLILTSMSWKWSPPADFKSIECSSFKKKNYSKPIDAKQIAGLSPLFATATSTHLISAVPNEAKSS